MDIKESIKLIYDVGRLMSSQFYDYLVNKPDLNFGFWVPIISLFLIFFMTILYYYIIDRPSTGKLKIWLIFLIGTGVITGIFAFIYANNALIDYGVQDDLTPDLWIFAFLNLVYSLIAFFLISIAIRLKSTNSSHVPF